MIDYQLLAITPIDGRYIKKLRDMKYIFSEYALIKYRLNIEIEYILFSSNSF